MEENPVDWTTQEKRCMPRSRFNEAVEYQLKNAGAVGGCLACDLSEGGIKVNFSDFLPLDTELMLRFRLQTSPQMVELAGRVVWAQQIPFSDRFYVGLKFIDPMGGVEKSLKGV